MSLPWRAWAVNASTVRASKTSLLRFRCTQAAQNAAISQKDGEIYALQARLNELTASVTSLVQQAVQHRHYRGVEIGNPAGPLGKSEGPKLQAYWGVLADDTFHEQIGGLLKKSIRDHKRFLAHFDVLETPRPPGSSDNHDNVANADGDDIVEQAVYAFLLSEALCPGSPGTPPSAPPPDMAALFTTYHPLLVESHFSMLLYLLIPAHAR